jgi:uncharacterized membrane protein
MARMRPLYGFLLVPVLVVGIFLAAGGFRFGEFTRVGPDPDGQVRVAAADLGPNEVHFYRFLNRGSQEVKFFVGKDAGGTLQVGFDASESHAKVGRGFRHQGEWMIDGKCETASRLAEVNQGGGGCRPVPLAHRLEGQTVVIAESDILKGWRLFN